MPRSRVVHPIAILEDPADVLEYVLVGGVPFGRCLLGRGSLVGYELGEQGRVRDRLPCVGGNALGEREEPRSDDLCLGLRRGEDLARFRCRVLGQEPARGAGQVDRPNELRRLTRFLRHACVSNPGVHLTRTLHKHTAMAFGLDASWLGVSISAVLASSPGPIPTVADIAPVVSPRRP